MGKNLGALLIIFLGSQAFAISLFGDLFEGLQKNASYKSTLPCESSDKNHCSIAQGLIGKALDTASSAGLDIDSVMIKTENEKPSLFVKTSQSGICHVHMNDSQQTDGLKFSCSFKDLKNDKLQSIDKVVILKKERNEKFFLEDITQKQNITR